MASATDPSNPPHGIDLDVCGAIPAGLAGRVVAIGPDGVVHSVHLQAGRASYRSRHLPTGGALSGLVAFGGSILAFGDDSPVYELSDDFAVVRPVDLAGRGRRLAGHPRHDPTTGELHVLAHDTDGVQAHVVVSAGALTRHSRPVLAAPGPIRDLVLTSDHCVFVVDRAVGLAPRDGEARTTWIPTGIAGAHPVQALELGGSIAVHVLTPSLECWVLHPGAETVDRSVLDETPRHFAHPEPHCIGATPRWMWSTGSGTIGRHDLVESHHAHHNVASGAPGDFVVVADARKRDQPHSTWLAIFVHEPSSPATELHVIEAADPAAASIATVHIPRSMPRRLRCTWMPASES